MLIYLAFSVVNTNLIITIFSIANNLYFPIDFVVLFIAKNQPKSKTASRQRNDSFSFNTLLWSKLKSGSEFLHSIYDSTYTVKSNMYEATKKSSLG